MHLLLPGLDSSPKPSGAKRGQTRPSSPVTWPLAIDTFGFISLSSPDSSTHASSFPCAAAAHSTTQKPLEFRALIPQSKRLRAGHPRSVPFGQLAFKMRPCNRRAGLPTISAKVKCHSTEIRQRFFKTDAHFKAAVAMSLLGAPASRRPVGSRKPEFAGGTPALSGTISKIRKNRGRGSSRQKSRSSPPGQCKARKACATTTGAGALR